jgi:hypothetical protein
MINRNDMINMIRKRNQAIRAILQIKVQTVFKELGYEIEL